MGVAFPSAGGGARADGFAFRSVADGVRADGFAELPRRTVVTSGGATGGLRGAGRERVAVCLAGVGGR
jgi:hypothetical protein